MGLAPICRLPPIKDGAQQVPRLAVYGIVVCEQNELGQGGWRQANRRCRCSLRRRRCRCPYRLAT